MKMRNFQRRESSLFQKRLQKPIKRPSDKEGSLCNLSLHKRIFKFFKLKKG